MLKKSLLFLFVIVLSSCVSKKKVLYFQDEAKTSYYNTTNFSLKFKKDDLLAINISSVNLEAVKPFNLPIVSYGLATNSVNGTPKQQSYLIDSNGEIQFPVIGKLKLAGLTRVEVIDLITKKITPFVNDVTVNVQILNFKINVIGDVKSPGTFIITNEKVRIWDVLALAGDLNISGERIIEIKRETEKGIVTGFIDLKSNDLFNSPFYYLQQNDIVYVRQNNAKLQSASSNKNTGLYISITSVLITLISILTR